MPYGIPPQREAPQEERERGTLGRYGITPGRYFLRVTRFKPAQRLKV